MRKVLLLVLFLALLTGTAFARSYTLTWTAPQTQKSNEKATSYILVYSVNPITELNFSQATTLTTNAPKEIGQTEVYTYELNGDAFYFAVKAVNGAGEVNAMSPVVIADFLPITRITDLKVSSP